MSNFWTRTITGLSMVFLLLFALWFDRWLFAGFFLIISILGLWEFFSLFTTAHYRPQRIYGVITGTLLYLSVTWSTLCQLQFEHLLWYFLPLYLGVVIFFLSFILEIYRKQPHPMVNIAITMTGVFYVAFPLAVLNVINGSESVLFLGFPAYLLGYFLLTWVFDTGAYLYGKKFGKHKFFERISPKKTWEGTIAGAIFSLLTAMGLFVLVKDIPLADWLVLAVIVLVFGSYGDLVESLFKRSLNIKDSGTILPGHGGILDRFDTMLISAPFVFLYFILRNGI